jgi:hypothetical protein
MMAGSLAAAGQRLYPVSGPAATQGPPAAFTAKMTGSGAFEKVKGGSAGKITLNQINGESFHGTWTTATASFANMKVPGTPGSYAPQPNLAFAWDAVYGQGYYVANILGNQRLGQAITTGSQGTTLQIEFTADHLGAPVDDKFGVAIDSKGNIYKVVL